MRIAVTGKTGQVASALRERAGASGIDVVSLGRPEMDLTEADSIPRAIAAAQPHLVINAAAFTAVDRAEDDESLAQAVNASGTRAVAATTAELGVPLFQISTDYVFDGKAGPYGETDTPAPLGAYGRTKLGGEQAAATNPRHAILRTSWVHSPFGSNFVLSMLRLARTRSEIGVVGDQFGTPTAASDIADAMLAMAPAIVAAPDDPALTGIFHLTSSGSTSWAGLAKYVFEMSREMGGPIASVREIATADYPTRALRPADSRLAGTRLAGGYGIVMPDWRTGVAETVRRILAGGRHLDG